MEGSPSRRPLHERTESETNKNVLAAIRLVPSTPPQLLGAGTSDRDDIYSRTPLPTHPSHILLAPGQKNRGRPAPTLSEFRTNSKAQENAASSGSSVSTTHTTPQPPRIGTSDTGSPSSRPKPPAKKRLQIHKDNKTFSLLQDDSQPSDALPNSPILALSNKASFDSLGSNGRHAEPVSNSKESCLPALPSTPAAESKQPISADPISNSPWNYELRGGLRKVPKTPDLKQKVVTESPLPPLPEIPDGPSAVSHDLSAKPSFHSTQTATTTSENTNYKVYGNTYDSVSDVALHPPSTSDSNYQLIGPPSIPSTASSVIHRPQTAISEAISESIWEDEDLDEFENYQIIASSSPPAESSNPATRHRPKYSQESLVVPPLQPRNKRSNENFGYYKSRSRESLRTGPAESFRTGSLTSITTVLSQQEAARAIVASGNLVNLPIPILSRGGLSSWAEKSGLHLHPPRSHMNEHPHQWSSQLSTVLSVSDGGTGTDRGSPSWSEGSRRNSGFPSTASRNSRQMQSISSSLAGEEAGSELLEPPQAAFARNGRRHESNGSIPFVGDQDEYGDGITDMQNLRARPSRNRLSGFFSVTSSDNGRTNTMRSTASSRANSMIASSIPTWARLYYGSGERKYLGAPGSSTESTMDSRANSFRSRSGSPNTDHFPLSIYSPRRRARDGYNARPETRGSLQINPAPQFGSDGQEINERNPRGFRTWSLSSVWSPHLRMDRRAAHRSVWEPPSVNWSADGSSFGKRNVQIIMFVIGFIFPFAWMIAAVLPLPLNPMSEMRERDEEHSTSNLDSSNHSPNDYTRQFGPVDERKYESARWWRNLNRWMSLVGLLIIAAIVVLVIVSIRDGWRKN
ncbi:hypothetical protein BGZ60DRAFT_427516 [Tricladium varicosporioides]|nr:hypothetical protein BGZ60DRAFT_427516 [Hymenoscyphus varicosporioides]